MLPCAKAPRNSSASSLRWSSRCSPSRASWRSVAFSDGFAGGDLESGSFSKPFQHASEHMVVGRCWARNMRPSGMPSRPQAMLVFTFHGGFQKPQLSQLLGGSWVVISGLICRVTVLITHIGGLITTTHEPRNWTPGGALRSPNLSRQAEVATPKP